MSTPIIYDVGDLARLSAVFTDAAGAAIDPTVVKLAYQPPGGSVTTLTYGTDPIIKDSAGHYHADLSVTASGAWYYRWYSTGTGQAAEEGVFEVRARAVIG